MTAPARCDLCLVLTGPAALPGRAELHQYVELPVYAAENAARRAYVDPPGRAACRGFVVLLGKIHRVGMPVLEAWDEFGVMVDCSSLRVLEAEGIPGLLKD